MGFNYCGDVINRVSTSFFVDKSKIKPLDLDPKVSIKFKGEAQDQKEAQAFLQKAFLVALFLFHARL